MSNTILTTRRPWSIPRQMKRLLLLLGAESRTVLETYLGCLVRRGRSRPRKASGRIRYHAWCASATDIFVQCPPHKVLTHSTVSWQRSTGKIGAAFRYTYLEVALHRHNVVISVQWVAFIGKGTKNIV